MILYNTLGGTRQEFIPHEEGKVKMYTCGPTVYHYAHIGNLRTYIMEDVLEKYLPLRGLRRTARDEHHRRRTPQLRRGYRRG